LQPQKYFGYCLRPTHNANKQNKNRDKIMQGSEIQGDIPTVETTVPFLRRSRRNLFIIYEPYNK
jgi:hypothetical protein